MELQRKQFLKLDSEVIDKELSELNTFLYTVTDSFNVSKVNITLKRMMNNFTDSYMANRMRDIADKERFISSNKERESNSTNAENLGKEFLEHIISKRKGNKGLSEVYDTFKANHKIFNSNSCRRTVATTIYTIAAREAMLNWYKENLISSPETTFLTAQTESRGSGSCSSLDHYHWKVKVINKGTPRVELGRDGSQYNGAYVAYLKPDWCVKVHEQGLAQTDIAGKTVLVLDAEPVTPKRVDLEGVNLFKIKVGYSLVPIGSNAWVWGGGSSATQQQEREATVNNKDLYLAYVTDTDGQKILATGKDEEWAQRTLKMRLKRTMLKTMGVL